MHLHTFLRTQIRTVLRKWYHSIETHFLKDRNCEVCLRTEMTRAPCRRFTGEALPRAQKFGDLITADHKVLNEGCESKDNHRYAVVVQDLPLNGFNPIRAKQTLHRRRKRVFESSSSRRKKQKLLKRIIHWNSVLLMEIHHGIIEHQHLLDPKQMALLKEPFDERKDGRR